MVWCRFWVVWCRLVVWFRVVWCRLCMVWGRFVGRLVLWVLGLSLIGDNGLKTFTMVGVGDNLLAAVREVHGVGALGLVAVTVLTVLEVGLGVVICCHIVGKVILRVCFRVLRGWVVGRCRVVGLWVVGFWVVGCWGRVV